MTAEAASELLSDKDIEMFRRHVKPKFSGILVDRICDQAKLANRRASRPEVDADARRYRFLRDEEYPPAILEILVAAGIHKSKVDAAIDEALSERARVAG